MTNLSAERRLVDRTFDFSGSSVMAYPMLGGADLLRAPANYAGEAT